MAIYVCIDDTDNIDSIGTGTVADYIKEAIGKRLGLGASMTTRHQLLIHEDIPYTSHNSSMCFKVEDQAQCAADRSALVMAIIGIATEVVETYMAEGSDPGVCVTYEPSDEVADLLIAFGQSAKVEVRTKAEAYALAQACQVHLSEHGGTGGGIIGALSGLGLRLSGNDGELKGGLKDVDGGVLTVETLLEREDVQRVYDPHKKQIVTEGQIHFRTRTKSLLRDGYYTLYVYQDHDQLIVHNKKSVRHLEMGPKAMDGQGLDYVCDAFVFDVPEEQLDKRACCLNCTYRRWAEKQALCVKGLMLS